MSTRFLLGGGWATAALCGLLAGCAAGKGDVSGQVKFQGSPLPAGRITFQSESGDRPVFSSPIKNGSYEISGVPTGAVKITVETFRPSDSDPVEMPKDLGIKPRAAAAAPRGQYVEIPPRYGDFEKSGLTYTVTAGSQTKDFDLTP